jgi:ABC-type nitrate/sulfonate/bicarbonate transport system substrate-binding protein
MTYNEKTKLNTYRWMKAHPERLRETRKKWVNIHYQNNKEKVLEYKKKYYIYKKECERLRNIELFE